MITITAFIPYLTKGDFSPTELKDTVGLTEINACGDAVRPILARIDEARTIITKPSTSSVIGSSTL